MVARYRSRSALAERACRGGTGCRERKQTEIYVYPSGNGDGDRHRCPDFGDRHRCLDFGDHADDDSDSDRHAGGECFPHGHSRRQCDRNLDAHGDTVIYKYSKSHPD